MQNEKIVSTATFRHYSRRKYAAFQSIGRQVRIGVLGVAMLSSTQVVAKQTSSRDIAPTDSTARESHLDEVTVTGALSELAMLQQTRTVTVITREEIARAAAPTVNDLLKSVAGVDVRQRGGFSVQTDVSIDGGTFDQTTVLLNGTDITNPQTGHHTMDLPVTPNDIERIEIIGGAASRIYGSAFGGAINIVTRERAKDGKSAEGTAGLQGGSWGTVCGDASVRLGDHHLSASAMRTDGGTDNSDMRRLSAFYRGSASVVDWQLSVSDKRYGANTFYSPRFPNQWESNTRYLATVGATIAAGGKFSVRPQVSWQRATDHFQLIRDTKTGENHHIGDVVDGQVRTTAEWGAAGQTSLTVRARFESIKSSNLGQPRHTSSIYNHYDDRTQFYVSANHLVRISNWTLSGGLTVFAPTSGLSTRLYPGVDIAYRPTCHWRLTLSYNRGFRLPTFTDLYYSGAERQGNGSLKPEETHSLSVAATHRASWITSTARVFYHHGTHMIDWVRRSADDATCYAADFELDNLGVSAQTDIRAGEWLRASLAYTYIKQWRKDPFTVYKSTYAGEYLRHKLTASVTHPLTPTLGKGCGPVWLSWHLRLCKRVGSYELYDGTTSTGRLVGYHPYAVLDLKARCPLTRHVELSVSAENVTNHRYYDLGNVPQPGICALAGVRVVW